MGWNTQTRLCGGFRQLLNSFQAISIVELCLRWGMSKNGMHRYIPLYVIWETWKSRSNYIFKGIQINCVRICFKILTWQQALEPSLLAMRIFQFSMWPHKFLCWQFFSMVRPNGDSVDARYGFELVKMHITSYIGMVGWVQTPGKKQWLCGDSSGSLGRNICSVSTSMATWKCLLMALWDLLPLIHQIFGVGWTASKLLSNIFIVSIYNMYTGEANRTVDALSKVGLTDVESSIFFSYYIDEKIMEEGHTVFPYKHLYLGDFLSSL